MIIEHTTPLISAADLRDIHDDEDVGIVDCRFALDDTERGLRDWAEATIPGARYAHLDRDLSGDLGTGERGRHPLLAPQEVAALRASWGFDDQTLLVCFDDAGGPFAARLWWMLRWIGHPATSVLDGGLQAWLTEGGPTSPGDTTFHPVPETEDTSPWKGSADPDMLASAEDLIPGHLQAVDARAHERYLGKNEPIDPVAGHIPGAVNMPWMDNLGPDGRFLGAEDLARRWASIQDASRAACYCGSGVTACHNVLAAVAGGLPLPKLYAPSWSGWIHDTERPVAIGRSD